MKKIKIGIFGAKRGGDFALILEKKNDVEIIGICDKDNYVIQELRKKLSKDIIFTNTFDEMLMNNPDAVILANNATEHSEYAIKCMKKGIHVFSEVLPCQTLKEAVELVECVEQTNCKYFYGENYCYMAACREMKRLISSGELGRFEYGEGEYIHNCEDIWSSVTNGDRNHWRNRLYATYYCTHSIGPLIHSSGLRPLRVVGFELPYADRCARMGRRCGTIGIEMITLENNAVIKSIHGQLDKNSIYYCAYGTKGRIESIREDEKDGGIKKVITNLDESEGIFEENIKKYDPDEGKKLNLSGHYGADGVMIDNFIDYLKGSKEADVVDIYEAMDMFLPGVFAYFSILDGGITKEIPNFRIEKERDKWRNDTRCTDPFVAGKMLIPTYSKGSIVVQDEVYENIKKRKREVNHEKK